MDVDIKHDMDALAQSLRGVADKKIILKELRTEMREPMPEARKRVKAAAIRMLPSRGGLGVWVSKTRLSAQIRINASSSRLTIKGGRGDSDIRRIDQGRVRHPLYGNRRHWYPQSVTPGFASKTLTEEMADTWRKTAVKAVEKAVRSIG